MEISVIVSIILLSTLFTSFLSSIFGMLGGLILMGVFLTILPVGEAMILHGLIQLTSNGYRAWLNKKDIIWPIILFIFIGNILALISFFYIAFIPNRITILLCLGFLPFLAWALPHRFTLDIRNKFISFLAGMVVVASNLFSGTGGPLLDTFFQRVEMSRYQVVATKAIAQSLGHISKIIFYGGLVVSASINNWPAIWLIFSAMILSVIGTTFGKKILDQIKDEFFFNWTQRIILCLATLFICRALYLLFNQS